MDDIFLNMPSLHQFNMHGEPLFSFVFIFFIVIYFLISEITVHVIFGKKHAVSRWLPSEGDSQGRMILIRNYEFDMLHFCPSELRRPTSN